MFEGELRASLTLRDAKGSAWQPYVCQRSEFWLVFLLGVARRFHVTCVLGQSLAALLGPLGEELISLRNEQHVPPSFGSRIAPATSRASF